MLKHTKKNIIKVLKAQKEVAYRLYKNAKERGDAERADNYLKECCKIDSCIYLMTDKKYFQEIAEIYEVTED